MTLYLDLSQLPLCGSRLFRGIISSLWKEPELLLSPVSFCSIQVKVRGPGQVLPWLDHSLVLEDALLLLPELLLLGDFGRGAYSLPLVGYPGLQNGFCAHIVSEKVT